MDHVAVALSVSPDSKVNESTSDTAEAVTLFLDNFSSRKSSSLTAKRRGRSSRQLRIIASALRTMGCVPKFFCGMNSENLGNSKSTLNDLAYLIKFAMA